MDNGNNQINYMMCPNCKQYVPYGSAFCNYCGFRFQYKQQYPQASQQQYHQSHSQQQFTNRNNIPQRNNYGWLYLIIIIGFVVCAVIWISDLTKKPTDNQQDTSYEEFTETTTQIQTTEEVTTESYIKKEDLSIDEIAEDGNIYLSLSYAKRADHYTSAYYMQTEDVDSDHELIYFFVEACNVSEVVDGVNSMKFDCYVDSVKASSFESYTLSYQDGVYEYNSYDMDPCATEIVLINYVVPKDWQEIKLFYDGFNWLITQDDVSDEPFVNDNVTTYDYEYIAYTEIGEKIYSDKYDVIYDGYSFTTNSYNGEQYIAFEFTINNTSGEVLDYSNIYNMRGYHNNILMDSFDYMLDDTLDGHTNIASIDNIEPGMTAKVYVAFKTESTTGDFSISYDVGYIKSEYLGAVMINIE